MPTFAEQVLDFYARFHLNVPLPENLAVMSPFREHEAARRATQAFFHRYYQDRKKRYMLIGINPGRFGSGYTGIPFTDPIRLREQCQIPFQGPDQREPSSVFIYEVIKRMGGPAEFYSRFYFSSVSPLGFLRKNARGKWVNFNYYDDPELLKVLYPLLAQSLLRQRNFGIFPSAAICIGTGKNFNILSKMNEEYQLFEALIPVEHPRFVLQYRAKTKHLYVDKYARALQTLLDT